MSRKGLLSGFIILLCASAVLSAAPQRGREARKGQARTAIKKTAMIIHMAQKKVREHRVYTGDFARSVAHQRFAKKQYAQGHFLRAIHHTSRARLLAINSLRANRGKVPADAEIAANDMKSMPDDSSLDAELQKEMPGQTVNDADLIAQVLDVDIE